MAAARGTPPRELLDGLDEVAVLVIPNFRLPRPTPHSLAQRASRTCWSHDDAHGPLGASDRDISARSVQASVYALHRRQESQQMVKSTDGTYDCAFDAVTAIARRTGSLPRISGNAVMSQRVPAIHDDVQKQKRATPGASSDPAIPDRVRTFLDGRLAALDAVTAAAYRCP